MKRTRAEMKAQAKAALRMNYWKLVLVSFLVLLLGGGGVNGAGTAVNAVRTSSGYTDTYEDYEYYDEDGETEDFYATTGYEIDPYYDSAEIDAYPSSNGPVEDLLGLIGLALPTLSVGALLIILGVLLVVAVVAILLDIFIFAPLRVGASRFFLVSQQEKAGLGELAWAFDRNYKHTVKTMFFRDLKLLLWTLLFIIPGIVKAYEYAAVPYLLAECPEMDSREVFAASRDLMDGNKWRAFVLDLSFLLWNFLSACTLGLLGIFYVNPYQNLTEAAFYQTICQEKAEEQNPPQWQGANDLNGAGD